MKKEFNTITKNEIENGFLNRELADYEDHVHNLKEGDPELINIMAEMPIYE